MTFPGKFSEQFVEGQMENVSLSFLVDDLVQHRGGAGANMAYGMGLLGLHPVLVGAVGGDFADYDAWLTRYGVDTASVHWSQVKQTARFVCTTDNANNQIASFYSGAMAEAADIVLVQRRGEDALEVAAVPETKPVEPTGGGDALRAGLVAGLCWGLGLERAAQVGSAVATAAVEVVGTQEYDLPREPFLQRFADAFGPPAAA